jgi:hypothetical protein
VVSGFEVVSTSVLVMCSKTRCLVALLGNANPALPRVAFGKASISSLERVLFVCAVFDLNLLVAVDSGLFVVRERPS